LIYQDGYLIDSDDREEDCSMNELQSLLCSSLTDKSSWMLKTHQAQA
jgi:hypothetical protein